MPKTAWFILGFFLSLLSKSFLGETQFIALAFLYVLSLFLLFFVTCKNTLSFLWGVTILQELLGNSHFGLAAALAIIIMFLHYLFAERLRFTDPYILFSVATALTLLAYISILFNPANFLFRLANIGIIYPILIILFFPVSLNRPKNSYEFI
jgi:hypothetical protein